MSGTDSVKIQAHQLGQYSQITQNGTEEEWVYSIAQIVTGTPRKARATLGPGYISDGGRIMTDLPTVFQGLKAH